MVEGQVQILEDHTTWYGFGDVFDGEHYFFGSFSLSFFPGICGVGLGRCVCACDRWGGGGSSGEEGTAVGNCYVGSIASIQEGS